MPMLRQPRRAHWIALSVVSVTCLLALFGSMPFLWPQRAAAATWCECVIYILNRFNNGVPLPNPDGRYSDAYKLDRPDPDGKIWMQQIAGGRFARTSQPQSGGVLVLQRGVAGANTSSGHIGVIDAVSSSGNNWVITLRSSNWGSRTFEDSGCSNVSLGTLLIAKSEGGVSYWSQGQGPPSSPVPTNGPGVTPVPTASPGCPAPELLKPDHGEIATSLVVTFRWSSVNCNNANRYRLWIIKDGGGDIIDPLLVNGTEQTVNIPAKYANTLLYWKVGAEISGRQESGLRPLRMQVNVPPPATLPGEQPCARPLLRYSDPNLQQHFLTTSRTELGAGTDSWTYEGAPGFVAGQQNCYPGLAALYRLRHAQRPTHLYTTDPTEASAAVANADYINEGVMGFLLTTDALWPKETSCLKPLLSYRNENTGRHLLTSDHNEFGPGRAGWVYQRSVGYVALTATCYVPQTTALVRLWHPIQQTALSTAVTTEIAAAEQLGFVRQGISGYVLPYPAAQYHTQPLYRLYDAVHNDHLYTTSLNEVATAMAGGAVNEGVATYLFDQDALTTVPQPLQPAVTSNYTTGGPGSSFIVTGTGLAPGSKVTLQLQNPGTTFFRTMGSAVADSHGVVTLMLSFLAQARSGVYTLQLGTASGTREVAAVLRTSLTIAPGAPQRIERSAGAVPEIIAPINRVVYLPLLRR